MLQAFSGLRDFFEPEAPNDRARPENWKCKDTREGCKAEGTFSGEQLDFGAERALANALSALNMIKKTSL